MQSRSLGQAGQWSLGQLEPQRQRQPEARRLLPPLAAPAHQDAPSSQVSAMVSFVPPSQGTPPRAELSAVTLNTLGPLVQIGGTAPKSPPTGLSDSMTVKFLVVTKTRDRRGRAVAARRGAMQLFLCRSKGPML